MKTNLKLSCCQNTVYMVRYESDTCFKFHEIRISRDIYENACYLSEKNKEADSIPIEFNKVGTECI